MSTQKTQAKPWFGPWASALLALPVLCVTFGSMFFTEGEGASLYFAIFTTAAVLSVLFTLTRRLLFSALCSALIVFSVMLLSWLKRSQEDMVLHAWDFVYFLGSREGWAELSKLGAMRLSIGCASLLVATVILTMAWRIDWRMKWWPLGLPALAIFGFIAAQATGDRPERRHTQFFWNDLFLGDFYASFAESLEAVRRGGLIAAERRVHAKAPFAPDATCSLTQTPPHVILIHEESMVQPDVFPQLSYDKSILPFFQSGDGQIHKMRTETYGGASWITEFSVMTGVSSRGYGSMRNYVQVFTSGRLNLTLPQVMQGCGYRNVFFTPWPKFIMAAARFYESIGFRDIFDRIKQGNKIDNERDQFFFSNMLDEIGRHTKASSAPLFVFLETMSAHWPYDIVYEPGLNVPGGGPGTDPEMSEFLRRVAIARMDNDWLKAELKRRFPKESFLIVRYGDHQPVATRTLLGYPQEFEAEDVLLPEESPGFVTFYAVEGLGIPTPRLPALDMIDVPYLGVVLLNGAGIPLPPSWRERAELMQQCEGRYWSCKDRAAILDFQARLVEAGELSQH